LVQWEGDWQTMPQPPQLVSLTFVLTHLPEHQAKPPGQAHCDAWQLAPPVHSTPQAPQLLLLRARSTHVPAHSVSPAAQTQSAFAQSRSGGHGWLHQPQ